MALLNLNNATISKSLAGLVLALALALAVVITGATTSQGFQNMVDP
jgi:hypothetical protein